MFGVQLIIRLVNQNAGSVFVAGSNPHPDVTLNTLYPTEYRTEKFYPAYFARTRPAPPGLPSRLGYGGAYWDITLRGTDLQGLGAKEAATKSMVNVIRTGFSTHGMVRGKTVDWLNFSKGLTDAGFYVSCARTWARDTCNCEGYLPSFACSKQTDFPTYSLSQAKYVHCQCGWFPHITRFPNAA